MVLKHLPVPNFSVLCLCLLQRGKTNDRKIGDRKMNYELHCVVTPVVTQDVGRELKPAVSTAMDVTVVT